MKVAISIPDDVFQAIDKIAKEQGGSRSQVFVAAAREYLQRREARRIVDQLDEVYAQPDTPEEIGRREAMKEYQRRRKGRGRP